MSFGTVSAVRKAESGTFRMTVFAYETSVICTGEVRSIPGLTVLVARSLERDASRLDVIFEV